jgi:hypothetical protein
MYFIYCLWFHSLQWRHWFEHIRPVPQTKINRKEKTRTKKVKEKYKPARKNYYTHDEIFMILWHDGWKLEYWNKNRRPLLGNGAMNTFPQKRINTQQQINCWNRVLCNLQRGLTAVNSWCERWNIRINEGKNQAIYFSRRLRVPEDALKPNRTSPL